MLADVLADYEDKKQKSLSVRADGTKTICNLGRLDTAFGGHTAAQITTAEVKTLASQMQRDGLANGTINLTLALLRRVFYVAVDNEKLTDAEVPAFKTRKKALPRKGFFELDEFTRLRVELPERHRTLVTLAFYTGMRWGEIARLRWENVDLERKKIRLDAGTTKNDEPRTVPLLAELPEMFENERRRFPGASYIDRLKATSLHLRWKHRALS